MAISTYTELKTAVANWLHRDDLTSRIPEFIAMGEAMLNRRLRVKEMESSATVTPSTTVRYVSLPAGYMELISFVDDLGDRLIPVDFDSLERIAYGMSATRPRYYRISSRIDFEAVADTTYSFTMRYFDRLDIATDSTNSVLTNHPDCYLYATLLQAAPYCVEDPRIPVWKGLLDQSMREANNQSTRDLQTLGLEVSSSGYANILTGA